MVLCEFEPVAIPKPPITGMLKDLAGPDSYRPEGKGNLDSILEDDWIEDLDHRYPEVVPASFMHITDPRYVEQLRQEGNGVLGITIQEIFRTGDEFGYEFGTIRLLVNHIRHCPEILKVSHNLLALGSAFPATDGKWLAPWITGFAWMRDAEKPSLSVSSLGGGWYRNCPKSEDFIFDKFQIVPKACLIPRDP